MTGMIPDPSKKRVVLVADDEANLALLLKGNLEEYGFDVVIAADGEDVLAKFDFEKPDVVILDVEMPKMNGWGVCESIRRISGSNSRPVILILSAYAQPEDIKKGLSLGANRYFTKPFKMKELIETIVNLLAE